MQEIVTSNHALTPGELLPFSWDLTWKLALGIYLLLAILFTAVCVAVMMNYMHGSANIGFIAFPAILVGGMLNQRYSVLPQQLKKASNSIIFADRVVRVSQDGYGIDYTNGMQTFVPWSVFNQVEVRHGLYRLQIPGGLNYYLPRRVLDHDQEQVLVAYLRNAKLMV